MYLGLLLHVNSAFLLIYSKIYKCNNCKMNGKKKHKVYFPLLDLTAIAYRLYT